MNHWLWNLLEEERNKAIILQQEETSTTTIDTDKNETTSPLLSSHTYNTDAAQTSSISLPLKPTHTVSSIETYWRCPREYQLKYNMGFEGNASSSEKNNQKQAAESSHLIHAPQWGKLIHEVMQFLDFNTLENQQTVIEQALVNQHLLDLEGKLKTHIENTLANLLRHEKVHDLLKNAEDVKTELPFLIDHGAFFIKGTFDRLFRHHGAWIILDFKTDIIRNEEDLKTRAQAYAGQMACYAVAASHILNISEISTLLLFTDGPHLLTTEWDKTRLSQTAKLLDETHQSLTQLEKDHTPFPFTQDPHFCRRCTFWELNYCGIQA